MNRDPTNLEPLFAYGTLLEGSVQTDVFGRTLPGSADILPGYARTTIVLDGESYPNVVPAANSLVEGQILYLNADDLERADAYETESYSRIRVTLVSGQVAWIYTAPLRDCIESA